MFPTKVLPELCHRLGNPHTLYQPPLSPSGPTSSLLGIDRINNSSCPWGTQPWTARNFRFCFVCQIMNRKGNLLTPDCVFLKHTARAQQHVIFQYFQKNVHLKSLFLFLSMHAARLHSSVSAFVYTYFSWLVCPGSAFSSQLPLWHNPTAVP